MDPQCSAVIPHIQHKANVHDIVSEMFRAIWHFSTSQRQRSGSKEAFWLVGNAEGALSLAWRPFAAGWKQLWWDSVATPDDITDETAFRRGDIQATGFNHSKVLGEFPQTLPCSEQKSRPVTEAANS